MYVLEMLYLPRYSMAQAAVERSPRKNLSTVECYHLCLQAVGEAGTRQTPRGPQSPPPASGTTCVAPARLSLGGGRASSLCLQCCTESFCSEQLPAPGPLGTV